MKEKFFLLAILVTLNQLIYGQDTLKVDSKVEKVVVFLKGAQIESEAKIALLQGKFLLSFINLSPYISKESIRVDGDGKFSILNVQFRNDYLTKLEKNKEIVALNVNIQQYQDNIEDEETAIKIINEKLDFLKSNKNVVGNQQTIDPEVFKSLNSIYGENFEKSSLEILKRQRIIKEYKIELEKLKNQLNSINSSNNEPSGVISVMVDSKQNQTSTFKLTYLVDSAGWYPSYDIRFLDYNKPISISYKANISQNTGIDWKNVELKLSTAKTNLSAQIPTLSANYLQFYYPELDKILQDRISGVTISENSLNPGSSSNLQIRGLSSFEGNAPLYVVDGEPISDISTLNPDEIESMEVLKGVSTAIYGLRGSNGVIVVTTKPKGSKSKIPLTFTSKNETSVEYSIEVPQTINADKKTEYHHI